jgi:hypothetical protein
MTATHSRPGTWVVALPDISSGASHGEPREPDAPAPRRLWIGRLGWPLAAAATAGATCLARYGYSFGTGDHLVLVPKGLSLANPGAYRHDWFVEHAPQPHWLFDAVTYAGARLGALPFVFLAYWLVSLLVFGTAAVWLSRRFLPGRMWPALLLGPVLVAGPEKILGSTTPLLGVALPHVLGGCLAFAALAAILNGYWRAAIVTSLLAGLVHVQHGADLAPVLLLTAALATTTRPRIRVALAGTAGLLLAGALLVGHWRQIDSGGPQWLEVCRVAIPFHCDANSWSNHYLASGAFIVLLALGLCLALRGAWRTLVPAVGLPAAGLLVAVAADRLDVPVLGHLAQTVNAYRLAAVVVPFAAFAVIWLSAVRLTGRRSRLLVQIGLPVVLAVWLTAPDAAIPLGADGASVALFATLLGVVVVAITRLAAADAEPRQTVSPTASSLRVITACLALVGAIVVGRGGRLPINLGYNHANPVIAAALDIGSYVPEGSVIAAPPSLSVVTISQRADIADCKRVPYGGSLWQEYNERMAALGGRQCDSALGGFGALTPADIEGLRGRYGATHVLLLGDDPKLAYARVNWHLVGQAPPVDERLLETGWWVFELPAR